MVTARKIFVIKNKEVHFKSVHSIYPSNSQTATFNISNVCVLHVLNHGKQVKQVLWGNWSRYLCAFIKCDLNFSFKDILFFFTFLAVTMILILLIFVLHCKGFIHKNISNLSLPRFDVFLAEISLIVQSRKLIENKF